MDIQERIHRQRVHHIVESYQLNGSDRDRFAEYLARLLENYPQSLVELALAEAIVRAWSDVPMHKGLVFIQGVHTQLHTWQPKPECLPPLSSSILALEHQVLGATSVNVQAAKSSPIAPRLIETMITPAQFELITGLDSSLVFDQNGQVLTAFD